MKKYIYQSIGMYRAWNPLMPTSTKCRHWSSTRGVASSEYFIAIFILYAWPMVTLLFPTLPENCCLCILKLMSIMSIAFCFSCHGLIILNLFLIMCICVPMYVHICTEFRCSWKPKVLVPLDFQIVGAGNQTWVLCKSNLYS